MGSHGGSAPNGLARRQATTLFLRVPGADWPRVKIGEKTEFRTQPKETSKLVTVNCPTPVVLYRPARAGLGKPDTQVAVLEERRFEPLFAVSQDPEAVAREGFETYDEFRRYWRARRHGVYRPMERVFVWRVRVWTDQDYARMGVALLERLYGDFLPPPSPLRRLFDEHAHL